MAEQKSSSALAAPLHGAASVLRRVPGAETVGRAAQGALDKVGAVSPRGRRLAVYTGAGLLGVAGVVEWPVALTGAAVAWLTQPRPERPKGGEEQTRTETQTPERPSATATTTATAARKPAKKRGTAAQEAAQDAGPGKQASAPDTDMEPDADTGPDGPGKAKTSAAGRGKSSKGQSATTGPLGPTARPDRTSL
ncbi:MULTISPECIES: hypothetical protein [unclassified Streptomyces]|uniref:hypothetical protein n=1 Tax=unclassified Streptomyces TaxID=2593676 RepID=UPI000C27FDB1|nr:hypothetical protein [Streptomyces sp. CB01373]PJM96761.1 hypothetical protein CG719_06245 [Streptomyces sp. CB01373]